MSSVKLNYAKLFRITKHLYLGTQNEDSFLIIQYILTLESKIKMAIVTFKKKCDAFCRKPIKKNVKIKNTTFG